MKRVLIAAAVIVFALVSLAACNTTLPVENTSADGQSASDISREVSAAQSAEDISIEEPSSTESAVIVEESSETSDERVSEEISEAQISEPEGSAEPVSEESSEEESVEESSEEISEETSGANSGDIGRYAAPYLEMLASGSYRIRTSETRTVGGEALPYTVTAYHKGGAVYYEIEESYGSKVAYLRKEGKLIVLDEFSKVAMVYSDDGEQFEKTLWNGDITLVGSGTEQLFETDYSYETYRDGNGFEFTLFFNALDELERYRSYDSSVKDTIVISLSVSADVSGGVFDIPSGYTVIED